MPCHNIWRFLRYLDFYTNSDKYFYSALRGLLAPSDCLRPKADVCQKVVYDLTMGWLDR